MKLCNACCQELPKANFSSNQWRSNRDKRRCKGCTAIGQEYGDKKLKMVVVETDNIMDIPKDELSDATRNGKRSVSTEDGSISYLYQGIVYVTTPDGDGITARRVDGPLQCTCHVEQLPGIENGFEEFDPNEDRNHSRVRNVLKNIFIELKSESSGLCGDLCLGGTYCKQKIHRTPTDTLSIVLEKYDWSSPEMSGVLSHPGLNGYLIVAAAGSLLRPVRCHKCYGVCKLKRSANIYDESDALLWLRQLFDVLEKGSKKTQGFMAMFKRASSENMVDRIIYPEVAAGMNPLAVAAIGGHYRCTLELLKLGATVGYAVWTVNDNYKGPLAGGHLLCYLMAQSYLPVNERIQNTALFCRYEDILALLCYGYGLQELGKGDVYNLPIERQEEEIEIFKRIGIWDSAKQQIDTLGYTLMGCIWDGRHYRFVMKGNKNGCIIGTLSGVKVIFNMGVRLPVSQEETVTDITYSDPLEDSFVKQYVRRVQQATKKINTKGLPFGCCQFSHDSMKAMMKEDNKKFKMMAQMMGKANIGR